MIVALNNKSNLDKNAYIDYLERLSKVTTEYELILCPTHLNIGQTNITNVKLGAENVSARKDGAFTGEVSASQLKSYGVEYTIVGHSERREYQKENFIDRNFRTNRFYMVSFVAIIFAMIFTGNVVFMERITATLLFSLIGVSACKLITTEPISSFKVIFLFFNI